MFHRLLLLFLIIRVYLFGIKILNDIDKFNNIINILMNRRYNRLFVSNVSSTANLDDLKDLFEKCGTVALFEIQNGQGIYISLGYVEFESS